MRRISRIFIYRECVTEVCEAKRNWRKKSSELIGQQQENKANWVLWFRPSNRWRNLFHFLRQEKNRLSIVQMTDQFNSFTLRFLSRQNVENKFVLTNKIFFRNFNPIRRLRVARKPSCLTGPLEFKYCVMFALVLGVICTIRSAVG